MLTGKDQHQTVAGKRRGAGGAGFSGGAGADDEQATLCQGLALLCGGAIVAVWEQVAGQHFDGAALAAQQGVQHLLFQRGVEAADEEAPRGRQHRPQQAA